MKKKVVNCETGEVNIVDVSEEEAAALIAAFVPPEPPIQE